MDSHESDSNKSFHSVHTNVDYEPPRKIVNIGLFGPFHLFPAIHDMTSCDENETVSKGEKNVPRT